MWPFKTNGILRRCVLPLAIRPRLPVLLVARVYGGIQLRPRSGKCSRNHDNRIDFGDKVNEPFWSCKWNHHFSVYDMNPEMEAVMEVYWQRRFAEEFVLWQREALGGTDGVLLLPGAPAPACFTSHLRPATSATSTSCSIDSVAIVGGQGEKLMAVRGSSDGIWTALPESGMPSRHHRRRRGFTHTTLSTPWYQTTRYICTEEAVDTGRCSGWSRR